MDEITSLLAILLITSLAMNIFLACIVCGYRKTCSIYREACDHYEAYIAFIRPTTANPEQIARIDAIINGYRKTCHLYRAYIDSINSNRETYSNEDNGVSE